MNLLGVDAEHVDHILRSIIVVAKTVGRHNCAIHNANLNGTLVPHAKRNLSQRHQPR